MDPDRKAELESILAQCDALPDDPEAQAVACGLRKSLYGPPLAPLTPFSEKMHELMSEYCIAMAEEDLVRQRELTHAIRLMLLSAFSQSSDATH